GPGAREVHFRGGGVAEEKRAGPCPCQGEVGRTKDGGRRRRGNFFRKTSSSVEIVTAVQAFLGAIQRRIQVPLNTLRRRVECLSRIATRLNDLLPEAFPTLSKRQFERA